MISIVCMSRVDGVELRSTVAAASSGPSSLLLCSYPLRSSGRRNWSLAKKVRVFRQIASSAPTFLAVQPVVRIAHRSKGATLRRVGPRREAGCTVRT